MKRKLKIKKIELNISENLMSAFVNGDESGLNESDVKAIQAYLKKYEYFNVLMPENTETNFVRCDVSKLLDDCVLCEVEVSEYPTKGPRKTKTVKIERPKLTVLEGGAFMSRKSSAKLVLVL